MARNAHASDPYTTSIGLMNFGWSFLRAAEQLAVCPPSSRLGFDEPIEFLAAQAMELLLKAFLLDQGLTVDQLRCKKLGHHIDALMAEANKKGLALTLSKKRYEHFQRLARRHGRDGFPTRYLSTNAKATASQPDLVEVVFPTIRSLMDRIERRIDPKRVKTAGLRTLREPLPSFSKQSRGLTVQQAAIVMPDLD